MGRGEGVRRGLTYAGLWLSLSPAGCQPTFRIPPQELPQVLRQYHRSGHVAFARRGVHYDITDEQQPELRVESDTCAVASTPGAPAEISYESACDDAAQGGLSQARIEGPFLRLPSTPPLRLDSIQRAEIVVEGKPARPTDRAGRSQRARNTLPVFLGGQIGGSGYFEILLQLAPSKYLHPEIGLMLFGPEFYFNGSAGFVAELPLQSGFAPYASVGAAAIVTAGPALERPCEKDTPPCPSQSSSDERVFGYARLGIAKYIPGLHDVRLALDAGIWAGEYHEHDPDTRERFLWPMGAGSVLVGLP
jgi:hypothetical protein